MKKFLGQVASEPERRDGRWHFFIWNTKENKGINCISSRRFEVDNPIVSFQIEARDEIEVIGEVELPGTCFFDCVKVLKKADQTVER